MYSPPCAFFFFWLIILAFSLCKTMAANYNDHFLSAVPQGLSGSDPTTPLRKFVNRTKNNRPKERQKEKEKRTSTRTHATPHPLDKEKHESNPDARSPWVTTPRVPPPPLPSLPPLPPPVPPLPRRCPSSPPPAALPVPRRWSARSRAPQGCISHPRRGPPLATSASPSSSPP